MTFSKKLRLRLAMTVARWLRVPIDVNGSYFGHMNRPATATAKAEGVSA